MKTFGFFHKQSYRIIAFSILAVGLTVVVSDPAHAGGGSWGSSTGGFGSSGGSSGSSGGYAFRTPIRSALARMHARHWSRRHSISGGSSGGSCGGSSGGSQGTWASTGSLGSSGSWSGSNGSFGSSGGYNSGSLVGTSMNSYYPTPTTSSAPISDGGSINSMLENGGTVTPTPAPVRPGADAVPKIESPGPDPGNDSTSTRQPDSRAAVLNLVLP